MTVYDLSRPVHTGMAVFPGDPEVSVQPALTLDGDGVAVSRLDLGSHTGTHVDAPAHSVRGGRTVDRIDPTELLGAARVLRVAAPRPDAEITAGSLASPLPPTLPPVVLVHTGWDTRFGHSDMTSHPWVSLALAKDVWRRGARVLGTDALSPDRSAPDGAATLPVHEWWLGRDGLIVENLQGLATVPDTLRVSFLPLLLAGVDGSPIRAVAWDG